MNKVPHVLEQAIGSVPAQMAAAAIPAGCVAAVGNPGVAFVMAAAAFPVLYNCFASKKYQQQHELWHRQVTDDLSAASAQISQLSNAQYHVLNEMISAATQTIDPAKLAYLRNAVRNTLFAHDVQAQEASLLGRVIRDMSAPEADFLCANFHFENICVGTVVRPPSTLVIDPASSERLIVLGLEKLALLEQDGTGFHYDGIHGLKFSRIAAKVLVLLDTPKL